MLTLTIPTTEVQAGDVIVRIGDCQDGVPMTVAGRPYHGHREVFVPMEADDHHARPWTWCPDQDEHGLLEDEVTVRRDVEPASERGRYAAGYAAGMEQTRTFAGATRKDERLDLAERARPARQARISNPYLQGLDDALTDYARRVRGDLARARKAARAAAARAAARATA